MAVASAVPTGVVGPSGSIGPSGMIGPSGPVQFSQPAWAFLGNHAHAHVAALNAHRAATVRAQAPAPSAAFRASFQVRTLLFLVRFPPPPSLISSGTSVSHSRIQIM